MLIIALLAVGIFAQEIPPIIPAGSAFGVLIVSIGLIWRVVRGINKTYKADVSELRRRLNVSERRATMTIELLMQTRVEVPEGFWERYWRDE